MEVQINNINSDNLKIFHIVFKVDEKHFPTDSWPLKELHQEKFISELKTFLELYELSCLGFTVLSSHAHAIFSVPNKHSVRAVEVKERYEKLYKRPMDARSKLCHKLQAELNSISAFVKAFEWHYAFWYNRSGKTRRKGSLWNPKFFRSELKDTDALINCWLYVQMNSAKAKMIDNPLNYKYCTLGDLEDEFNQKSIKKFLQSVQQLDPYWRVNCYDEFVRYLLLLIDNEVEQLNKDHERYVQDNSHWTKQRVIGTPPSVEKRT